MMACRRTCLAVAARSGLAAAWLFVYLRRVEPWLRRWGTTEAEHVAPLAVDDLVEPGARSITRAITVHAPIDDVWPWLIQIGRDRAGFYSYRCLENLVGAGMHNASYVHPDWQQRQPGDSVWLASKARWRERGRQVAALVEPPRAFVLVSPADWARLQSGERASGAWAFFLEPHGPFRTRFDHPQLRWCGRYPPLRRDPLPDGAEDDAWTAGPRRGPDELTSRPRWGPWSLP